MTSSPSSDHRLVALHHWLLSLPAQWKLDSNSLAPASSDASFRRYFRIHTAHPDHPTLIIMDAPPAHENCQPFITVAALLQQAGVHVPEVLAQDLQQGFLLLSDLGNTTYAQAITAASATSLYAQASHALIKIQLASRPDVLPNYTQTLLQQELSLFDTWYLARHHQCTLSTTQQTELQTLYQILLANNLAQPQVYVHRDYHCRNLMVCQHDSPGILDFQDAVVGPITYDLVSLWRDAYIEWPEAQQLDWLARYWQDAKQYDLPVAHDFGDFYRDYEWMGLQRHLKILGIFARLYHRDGKDAYLQYLPRVLRYTRDVAQRYREFKPLLALLDIVPATTPRVGYTF